MLDEGRVLLVDDVAGVRRSTNAHVQNLLNRRVEETEIDPAAYLRRLTGTGESRATGPAHAEP